MGNPFDRRDTLGAAIFGDSGAPLPFEAQQDIYDPARAGEGEGPFGSTLFGGDSQVQEDSSNPYLGMAKEYLAKLQQPVQLPQRPKMGRWMAGAMVLDPERAKATYELAQEPYREQMAQLQYNDQRQAKAGEMAGRMGELEEGRQSRNYQQNWTREMSAANAGVSKYPFTIPGMRETAARNAEAENALTAQRRRAHLGVGAKPKFPNRMSKMSWLETQIRSRQSQLSQMITANQTAFLGKWDRNPEGKALVDETRQDYERLRSQQEALRKMSEDQFLRYQELPEEEQDMVMESMNHTSPDETMSP